MPTRWSRPIVPAALLALFVTLAVGCARWMSATFDEPFHLTAGYAALRLGDFRFGPSHPPLVRMWSSLPNVLDPGLRFPTATEGYLQGKQWTTSRRFLDSGNTLGRPLLLGRLMVILLATGLGMLIYLWTRRLAGPLAATLALSLFVLEPNLMAHGSLVTTDMGVTLFFTLTAFALWLVLQRLTAPRVALLGLCFALAQVSKFSALALWPAAIAALALRALGREPWEVGAAGTRLGHRRGRVAAAAGVTLVLVVTFAAGVWGVYRFRYEMAPRPGMPYDTTEDEVFAASDQELGRTLGSIRLLPEGYVRGVGQLATWPRVPFYFAGSVHEQALWYFYPVVLLVKTPTALLLLAAFAAGLVACRRARPPDGWQALALPPAALLLAGMASGVNTGVRHLLPVFPFMIIAAGAAAARLARDRRGKAVIAALALLTLIESTAAYPDALAAFNLPSGGPGRGDRWLVNTDMDWGQGMNGLKRWLDSRGVTEINLACHTFLTDYGLGFRSRRLPLYETDARSGELRFPPGYLAASVSVLRGYTLTHPSVAAFYRRLLEQRPEAVVGGSVRVYRLDHELRFRRIPDDAARGIVPWELLPEGAGGAVE